MPTCLPLVSSQCVSSTPLPPLVLPPLFHLHHSLPFCSLKQARVRPCPLPSFHLCHHLPLVHLGKCRLPLGRSCHCRGELYLPLGRSCHRLPVVHLSKCRSCQGRVRLPNHTCQTFSRYTTLGSTMSPGARAPTHVLQGTWWTLVLST